MESLNSTNPPENDPAIEIIRPGRLPLDEESRRLLASGRGSLAFLLGDLPLRIRLLEHSINPDRIFIAKKKRKPTGYLSFQWRRTGPYHPSFSNFYKQFSLLSALWRYPLFLALEWRTYPMGFYLYGLHIDATARGLGIGKALVEAAESWAVEHGEHKISLEVHDFNTHAKAFYEKLGYTLEGETKTGVFSRVYGFKSIFRLSKII